MGGGEAREKASRQPLAPAAMASSKGSSGQGQGGRIDKFFQPTIHSSAKRPLDSTGGGVAGSKRLAKVSVAVSPMLVHATPGSLHTEAAAKRPISASEGAGSSVNVSSRTVGAAIAASSERRESPLAPSGAAPSSNDRAASKLVPPVLAPATAMAR